MWRTASHHDGVVREVERQHLIVGQPHHQRADVGGDGRVPAEAGRAAGAALVTKLVLRRAAGG